MLAGKNPDYAQQDLFEAIERKEFPSWTLNVQIMTPQQAEDFRYNILDLTKIWSHKDVRRFRLLRTGGVADWRTLAVPPPPRWQAHAQREPGELLW